MGRARALSSLVSWNYPPFLPGLRTHPFHSSNPAPIFPTVIPAPVPSMGVLGNGVCSRYPWSRQLSNHFYFMYILRFPGGLFSGVRHLSALTDHMFISVPRSHTPRRPTHDYHMVPLERASQHYFATGKDPLHLSFRLTFSCHFQLLGLSFTKDVDFKEAPIAFTQRCEVN